MYILKDLVMISLSCCFLYCTRVAQLFTKMLVSGDQAFILIILPLWYLQSILTLHIFI